MQIEIRGNKIFAPLKKEWIPNTQDEKLKQEFICRLVNNYGYKLGQLGQDVEIKKRYKADIAVWRSEKEKFKKFIPSIIITIECKAEHIKIKEADYSIGYNFASTINANFFIAVNLIDTKVFHIIKDNNPKQLEKLIDLPKADIILDDRKIEKYIKETKAFTRDEFTKLLSRCHNIIRNNDKLSPEAAFDEISKVLFMKIMFEKESKEEMIFSKGKFISDEKQYETVIRPELKKETRSLDQDYMQFLFGKTKSKFENDGIFEPKDQIKIKRNSFEMIVEELESFNLSDTSDDVKGIAFEQFLGKTFRGELGQFFTPRTIVEYMIEILDPQEGELICDPCCGSGGFLITAFEFIRNKINEDIRQVIINIKSKLYNSDFDKLPIKKQKEIDNKVQDYLQKLNSEFDIYNIKSRYHKLSHHCIFGTDANPRMSRTAKMNMIMHGDGHGGVHHHDGLINVDGVFDGRFDIILTNPPFGARVEKSLRVTPDDLPNDRDAKLYISKYGELYEENVLNPLKEWAYYNNGKDKPLGKSILEIFELGSSTGLTEVLFLERCINLLKPGGRMGIVLPEGILNNPKMQKIRDFVERKAKIINITSIPQDVFIASGATVKPSLLFFKKFTEAEVKKFNKISVNATKTAFDKFQLELDEIESKLIVKKLGKEAIRDLKDKRNQILQQIDDEIKLEVKAKFDYEIPIIEVEKAGISSTGAPIENELVPVAEEFKKYRVKNKLWNEHSLPIRYDVYNDKIQRVIAAGEPEFFYENLT
jgi:type I restriction enzyme M protein